MAHFAQLDENNIVIKVLVVDNKDIIVDGKESEKAGVEFLNSIGLSGKWVQTSYNGKFRNKYASNGDIYDPINDVFIQGDLDLENYESPWIGINNPLSPSLIADSVVRCGNRWFNLCINKAFPSITQKWGYLNQHNPNTFEKSQNKFDIIATIIRNPLDILASAIVSFNLKTEEEINKTIDSSITILEKTVEFKDSLKIFKFEDVINNIQSVMNFISNILNVPALQVDVDEVKSILASQSLEFFYSVPNDNNESIENAKNIILQGPYSEKMNQMNSLYNNLIPYSINIEAERS